jgi:hypothetical protein
MWPISRIHLQRARLEPQPEKGAKLQVFAGRLQHLLGAGGAGWVLRAKNRVKMFSF